MLLVVGQVFPVKMYDLNFFKGYEKKNLRYIVLSFIYFFLTAMVDGSCIHVIGDSHSREFTNIPGCVIHHIGPITMHRVGRDGLGILNLKSYNIEEGNIVVFAFGEIDVRCHIGRQCDLKGRDIDEV